MAVLGEVPGQGTVYRRGGVAVSSESSYIRERARENGMTMKDLADRVGVTYGYLSSATRGHANMGTKVQSRIESALDAPARVAPAACANRPESVVSGGSSYIRERARALGMTMRELAERVGVSASYMSMVARGHRSMGVKLQARVEEALEGGTKVAPAEWRPRRPAGPVGADGRPRFQPERGGPSRRHELRPSLPDRPTGRPVPRRAFCGGCTGCCSGRPGPRSGSCPPS